MSRQDVSGTGVSRAHHRLVLHCLTLYLRYFYDPIYCETTEKLSSICRKTLVTACTWLTFICWVEVCSFTRGVLLHFLLRQAVVCSASHCSRMWVLCLQYKTQRSFNTLAKLNSLFSFNWFFVSKICILVCDVDGLGR